MKNKISVFGHSNFDRAAAREEDIIPFCTTDDATKRRIKYYEKSTFANANNFTSFTAKNIPQPKGKILH